MGIERRMGSEKIKTKSKKGYLDDKGTPKYVWGEQMYRGED